MSSYAVVALFINAAWSLVWSLTGSSASSLQEAVSGTGGGERSMAALVAKLFTVAALFGCFTVFARFAKAHMQPPGAPTAAVTVPSADGRAALPLKATAVREPTPTNQRRRRSRLARSKSPNARRPSPPPRRVAPTALRARAYPNA